MPNTTEDPESTDTEVLHCLPLILSSVQIEMRTFVVKATLRLSQPLFRSVFSLLHALFVDRKQLHFDAREVVESESSIKYSSP